MNVGNNNFMDLLLNTHNYINQLKKEKKAYTHIAINTANHLLNYKGTVSEYSNLLSMIYEKADKNTKRDIDRFRELRVNLSNIYNNIKKDNTQPIEYIEEEISKIEIRLNKNIKEFREFNKLKNISIEDISKILNTNELYIDFIRSYEEYYLFTIDKFNHIEFKQIAKKDTIELDKTIQIFRKNNKNKATKSIKETKQILNDIYNILSQYINFKSKKSLIISPDGLLNFLPFEALYDGEKYLVESVNISYIPSGRELVRQSRRNESKTKSDNIVVFAHPDYDLTDRRENPKSYTNTKSWNSYLAPLTGSLEEAKIIKYLYPKSKTYKDKEATIEALFKIKSPKILHISTHGKFVDDRNITNPMQQTFLAFVDANLVPRDRDYRGIATALKLSSLSLNNTELVFLSACETGLGTIQTAEGVQGLPKAFIQAGAKNIIMSLWQVDDSKTTELTRYFYENIKSGMIYKEALREAKLKMIEMHPYYWSGFVFSGLDI